MSKRVLQTSIYLTLLLGSPVVVLAAPKAPTCDSTKLTLEDGTKCAYGGGTPTDLMSNIKNITNLMLLVVGIAGVLMIIVGGLMYVFSSGDGANTKRAKDTILYASVGLVVALLAYAIVNLVVTRFTS